MCADACTMADYDVEKPTVIQYDASSFALLATLVFKVNAYVSLALNNTKQWYSQIQKEIKAMEFSCNLFHTYRPQTT